MKAPYGVFTRREALTAGLSKKTIERRLMREWVALHPCVYSLRSYPGSWARDLYAACRWAKDGLASHRAAGALFELPGCDRSPIEITVTRCHLAPRSGIRMHHTNKLPKSHSGSVRQIPCTSLERTLLDLGAVWPRVKVATALDDALRRGLVSVRSVDQCLGQVAKRGRRGVRGLRELLRERWLLASTPNSPLESRLFELIAASDLPLPECQYEIKEDRFAARVDFCYPEEMLIIEADSWKHHSGRQDWSRDIDRRNQLSSLGWRVLNLTWSDVTESPERTVGLIRRMLGPNFL